MFLTWICSFFHNRQIVIGLQTVSGEREQGRVQDPIDPHLQNPLSHLLYVPQKTIQGKWSFRFYTNKNKSSHLTIRRYISKRWICHNLSWSISTWWVRKKSLMPFKPSSPPARLVEHVSSYHEVQRTLTRRLSTSSTRLFCTPLAPSTVRPHESWFF